MCSRNLTIHWRRNPLTLYRDIASIGALITVLSLAFDPFMQQVVAYNLRTVHFANTTIGRTPHYAEDHNTADLYGTSLKLRAAMYNGLFNGNAAQQLTPVCPTGNRTWDPMSSLAICSSCENLAPESALSCNRTTPVNRQGGIGSNTLIEANVTCKYTMSQWLQDFTVQEYKLTDGSSIGGQVLQVSALHAIGLAAAENLTFAGKKNPWAGFARVMIDSSYSTKFTNVTVCSFYPCIKTYNISVSGGNFVSHNLHTWSSNPYYLDSYDVGNIVLLAPRDAVSSSTTNTTFSVEVYTGGGLVTLLEDAFNGSATGPPHPNDYEFEFNFYTSDIMQALYMTDDLGQLMDNVAASITNHMRNISSEPALGKVWAIQTYVHVRWIWLVLPMALAPASLLFLLTAIWSSKRKGVQVWKSSALADIFHGLESPVDVRNVDQQSDMEHVSKEVFVRLQQTNGGIQKLVCRDDVTAPANCDLVQTALPAVGNQERRWSDPATAHSQRNGNGTASFLIPRRPVGSGPGSRDDPEATSHR